eukprot:scaffold277540_cov36-Tisochrysis_lutea.AAC.2
MDLRCSTSMIDVTRSILAPPPLCTDTMLAACRQPQARARQSTAQRASFSRPTQIFGMRY